MILDIEGKRVKVDDSFAKLSPEEQDKQVQEIAQSMFPKKVEAPRQETTVAEGLNETMYPIGGAVAGAGLEAKRGLSNFAKNISNATNPELMAEAKLKADLNAVEKYGRTQHRVPGMPMEKPGLYFNQPTYELESKRAREEIAKMMADPEYQNKVLSEQKPSAAQYQKRVNPSMMQRAGNFLGKTPLGLLGGAAVGAGAGMQAADVVNRYNQGDKLGAAIGGLGTLGTGMAMIPTPATRIGGTALSIGAESLNAYIDLLKKGNPFDKFLQSKPVAPPGQPQAPQQQPGMPPNPMGSAPPQPPQLQQPPQPQQPPAMGMKEGGAVKKYADGGLATSFAEPMAMMSAEPMAMMSAEPQFEKISAFSDEMQNLPYQINEKAQGTPFYRQDDLQPRAMEFMQNQPMMTTTGLSSFGMQPPKLPSFNRQQSRAMPMGASKPQGIGFKPNRAPLSAMAGAPQRRIAAPLKSGFRPAMRGNVPQRPRRFFAEGGPVNFNPEGSDYDYQTALAYGMGPNGAGENLGHWGSVAPTSDDERMLRELAEESYVMLKGKNHDTYDKAEAAEKQRGSKIVKVGDRYYSVPK